MTNGAWKWLTGLLAAVIVSVGGSWATFGGGVTQAQTEIIVDKHPRVLAADGRSVRNKGDIDKLETGYEGLRGIMIEQTAIMQGVRDDITELKNRNP